MIFLEQLNVVTGEDLRDGTDDLCGLVPINSQHAAQPSDDSRLVRRIRGTRQTAYPQMTVIGCQFVAEHDWPPRRHSVVVKQHIVGQAADRFHDEIPAIVNGLLSSAPARRMKSSTTCKMSRRRCGEAPARYGTPLKRSFVAAKSLSPS
jgi:hypothetical protein